MREYEFHPLANDYPLMLAFELGRLEEAMREHGFDERFPLVTYQGKILDGRNRYLAAKAAGLKKVPTVSFRGTQEAAGRFVVTANEERRHLAAEWLQQRRQERIERAVSQREQGESLRSIADKEGVSVVQIQRDLEEGSEGPGDAAETSPVGNDSLKSLGTKSRAPGGTVETSQVGNKNGASAPSGLVPVLAARNLSPKLLKQLAGLETAQQLAINSRIEEGENPRAALKAVLSEPVGNGREPGDDSQGVQEELKDAEGETVPAQAVSAFGVAKEISGLCRELDGVLRRVEEIAGGPGGRLIRLESVRQMLRDAKGNLWANRATHVCPYCHGKPKKGKPCECCKGEGWTAKHVWSQAPGTKGKGS